MECGSMMDASLADVNADCNKVDSCDEGKQRGNGWTYTHEKKSLLDEISRFSAAKQDKVMKSKEPGAWRMGIQEQIEQEIAQRVREALDTPPLERIRRNREKAKIRRLQQVQHANRSHSVTTVEELKAQKVKKRSKKKRPPFRRLAASTAMHPSERTSDEEDSNRNIVGTSGHFKIFQPNLIWTNNTPVSTSQSLGKTILTTGTAAGTVAAIGMTTAPSESVPVLNSYTKKGFQAYVDLKSNNRKSMEWFRDENGVLLTLDGPFWPPGYSTPVVPKPLHILQLPRIHELLSDSVPQKGRTVHNQRTRWFRPWDGTLMVYDSERSSRTNAALDNPEGCCSSLLFESRFESGNLRQAKRVGQFEYELLLKTDLYTNRHTQWYYFRIQHMLPGVTYKFTIINLLKRDSLYNHGMRPLLYSEKKAATKGVGWIRSGHHIGYSRNYSITRNPLLHPDMAYYALEWQMEFDHEDDTCYLAHCYPFTFTDLKEHIDSIIADPVRGCYLHREVMCETRAGNSCFLLTISSSNGEDIEDRNKKGVVITARVHPGETNSSWIMKGVIDFLTGLDQEAQELRRNFIFKIVPMLNPDGVIVGNYRCSLAARDLNRNYRNPRKESFPTIWHTKQMLETFSRQREVLVYCDLHGHSRKHNVFIYGCDSKGTQADPGNFLCLRLFPWLMAQKAPDKFTFRGCKFQVRKCKESTGRVVMWRQLGIANSFTLEATFCGSKNTAVSSRHFNLKDFEELGHQFGQVILQYHTAKNNQSLHSELILEMTRDITHQVLAGRGMMPMQLINHCKGGKKTDVEEERESCDGNQNQVKKEDVKALIQQITEETFEGCIGILEDLDAIQEFAESDTSDSDSGSDSEMTPSQFTSDANSKAKNKKRSKNRARSVPMLPELTRSGNTKQRIKKDFQSRKTFSTNIQKHAAPINNKEQQTSDDRLPRLPPHKLIHISQQRLQKKYVTMIEPQNMMIPPAAQLRIQEDTASYWKNALDFNYHSTKQNSTSLRASNSFTTPKYPAYVNRYIGRSNGGIPMYANERIGERATKRMESAIDDVDNKGLTKEEKYARLVALTREIKLRTDETPYKLTERNQLGIPPAGPVLIRQSYTHAGPGVLRGPPALRPPTLAPPALAQDTAKLSVSDKSDPVKLHNIILNQQITRENMIPPDSFAKSVDKCKKYTSPSELGEKGLRPNSFIGCSKELRMATGSDVCTCFECQEVGKSSTSDVKTGRSKSHRDQSDHNSKSNLSGSLYGKMVLEVGNSSTSDVKTGRSKSHRDQSDQNSKSNLSGSLHGKMVSEVGNSRATAWTNHLSVANSLQGDKNIDNMQKQYSVFLNGQSKVNRYVHGISKERQANDGNTGQADRFVQGISKELQAGDANSSQANIFEHGISKELQASEANSSQVNGNCSTMDKITKAETIHKHPSRWSYE